MLEQRHKVVQVFQTMQFHCQGYTAGTLVLVTITVLTPIVQPRQIYSGRLGPVPAKTKIADFTDIFRYTIRWEHANRKEMLKLFQNSCFGWRGGLVSRIIGTCARTKCCGGNPGAFFGVNPPKSTVGGQARSVKNLSASAAVL